MTVNNENINPSHKQHYLVLDAARGLAALIVMLYHAHTYIFYGVAGAELKDILNRSFLAVDLFFLMSGFVIARSYEAKLLDGRMSFVKFIIVRLIRFYPLYIIGLVLGFIYAIVKAKFLSHEQFEFGSNLLNFLASLLFIPNPSKDISGLFPYDHAAWSLAFEWGINLIYAAWVVRLNTLRLTILTCFSSIGLFVFVLMNGSIDMGWMVSTMAGGSLRICYAFSLGVLLYRFITEGIIKLPQVNPVVLLMLLVAVLLTPWGCQSAYYDLFCVLLLFPLFVIFACQAHTPQPLNRLFTNLGRLSYGLYIIHDPLIFWVGGIFKVATHRELSTQPVIYALAFIASIILISFLIISWVDEPVRRWLSKKLIAQ